MHKLTRYKKTNISSLSKIIPFILIVIIALGIGYSYLNTNLSISGNINVKKNSIFPEQIQDIIDNDTCITKYTGQVTDQVGETVTASNVYFNKCADKRNIIFANMCWQMVRTTETGGIKMIYNGDVVDGKCESTRVDHKGIVQEDYDIAEMDTSYLYGSSFTYDISSGVFTLEDTFTETWSDSTYENILGKFTCKSNSSTCTKIYEVSHYFSSTQAYYTYYNIDDTNYAQIGTSTYSVKRDSLGHAGYMYNKGYKYNQNSFQNHHSILERQYLNNMYLFADSVEWGNPVADRYNLIDSYKVTTVDGNTSLEGKYTFFHRSNTSASVVYYIVKVVGPTAYCIALRGGSTPNDFVNKYTYGDSYTDNGNDTYTINNPSRIDFSTWYDDYANVKHKYICVDAVANICSEVWYTDSTGDYYFTYERITSIAKYANNFTYDENTNTYTLNNDSVTFWVISDTNNRDSLNTHHYTCWNTTGTCTNISYVFYLNQTSIYYIILSDGKGLDEVLEEMLYTNTYDSNVKGIIDNWYKQTLLSYDNKIEDTVYCNARNAQDVGGWNLNGLVTNPFYFINYNSNNTNLACQNLTDQFSISNNKAKLSYPISLIGREESNNMGTIEESENLRKTGAEYWLLSPSSYTEYFPINYYVNQVGKHYGYDVFYISGIRPAISLKRGITINSGDGSETNPWIVN